MKKIDSGYVGSGKPKTNQLDGCKCGHPRLRHREFGESTECLNYDPVDEWCGCKRFRPSGKMLESYRYAPPKKVNALLMLPQPKIVPRKPRIPKLVKSKKAKKPIHVDKLSLTRALPADDDEV